MKTNEPQNSIKPIKTIAGEILLYLYWMHRKNIAELKNVRLTFGMWRRENVVLDRREATIFSVDKFKDYSDNDLFGALQYLNDLYLIEYKDSPDNTGSNFFNFKVTAHGIQMVEGVEHSQEEKNQFNVTFNFNLENNVTIESLLKAHLGSLFKASLI
jgi:hypothetical protein